MLGRITPRFYPRIPLKLLRSTARDVHNRRTQVAVRARTDLEAIARTYYNGAYTTAVKAAHKLKLLFTRECEPLPDAERRRFMAH